MLDCQVAEVTSYAALAIAPWRCMTNPQKGAMEGCVMTMEDFYNALKEIFPEKFKLDDGSLFYHYTTIDTFDKLVDEGGELYCTHYMDLNDDVEFWKGFGYFEKYLLERKFSDAGEEHIGEHLRKLKTTWQALHKLHTDVPWIMSFTTEKDSLSQWRAYTDRARGGIAIGFSKEDLECEIRKCYDENMSNKSVMLLPCIYQGTDVNERLDELLGQLIGGEPSQLVQNEGLLRILFSIIKDRSFESEHEWRIVVHTADNASLAGVKIIGNKARIPIGIGAQGAYNIRSLVREVIISPHGDKNRLWHSVLIPLYSSPPLKCKRESSGLTYNGK